MYTIHKLIHLNQDQSSLSIYSFYSAMQSTYMLCTLYAFAELIFLSFEVCFVHSLLLGDLASLARKSVHSAPK